MSWVVVVAMAVIVVFILVVAVVMLLWSCCSSHEWLSWPESWIGWVTGMLTPHMRSLYHGLCTGLWCMHFHKLSRSFVYTSYLPLTWLGPQSHLSFMPHTFSVPPVSSTSTQYYDIIYWQIIFLGMVWISNHSYEIMVMSHSHEPRLWMMVIEWWSRISYSKGSWV